MMQRLKGLLIPRLRGKLIFYHLGLLVNRVLHIIPNTLDLLGFHCCFRIASFIHIQFVFVRQEFLLLQFEVVNVLGLLGFFQIHLILGWPKHVIDLPILRWLKFEKCLLKRFYQTFGHLTMLRKISIRVIPGHRGSSYVFGILGLRIALDYSTFEITGQGLVFSADVFLLLSDPFNDFFDRGLILLLFPKFPDSFLFRELGFFSTNFEIFMRVVVIQRRHDEIKSFKHYFGLFSFFDRNINQIARLRILLDFIVWWDRAVCVDIWEAQVWLFSCTNSFKILIQRFVSIPLHLGQGLLCRTTIQ